MSLTIHFEDFYEPSNDTISISTYIPDPRTLSCNFVPSSPTTAVILCVVYSAIFLFALPGNLLVGWVILANRSTLTPSDVYLFHLTIADALLALTLPFSATVAIKGWIFGDFLCKLISLITEQNFYTSILFLVCISIDRYLVIVHAAESRKDIRRICSWIVCVSIWVLGCALGLPALFNDAFIPNKKDESIVNDSFQQNGSFKLDDSVKPNDSQWTICYERYDIGSATSWRLATRGLRHILGFILPLVVMVTCYSVTIARLLRTRGFQKHRAMQVIVAVVVAFLLCWTPYQLAVITDTFFRFDMVAFDCAKRSSADFALLVTHALAMLHCCINPIVYAFIGKKFRTNLSMLIRRHLRPERMSSVSVFSRSTSQTSEANGTLL